MDAEQKTLTGVYVVHKPSFLSRLTPQLQKLTKLSFLATHHIPAYRYFFPSLLASITNELWKLAYIVPENLFFL